MGGQGVFVKEVQAAVLDGRADVAVHSAKDLPSTDAPGSGPGRRARCGPTPGTPWSAAPWPDLVPGALVATGSVRRRAQLAWLRPDLTFTGLRGNIADPATSGSRRAGRWSWPPPPWTAWGCSDRAAEILRPTRHAPAGGAGRHRRRVPGRRRGDPASGWTPSTMRHLRSAVTAERAFLARLGGGCDLPVGALARPAAGATAGPDLGVEGCWLRSTGGWSCARRSAARPVHLTAWVAPSPISCFAPAAPIFSGRASKQPARAGDRLPGRRRARRPRAADRAGRRSAAPAPTWSSTTGWRMPGLLELAPPAARRIDVGKAPGGPVQQDEINALLVRRGPGRPDGGPAQGRRPVRVRPGRRGGPGPAGGRRALRGGARHHRPLSPCRPTPGCRSPTGGWPRRSPSSPATAGTPSTGRPTGKPWRRRAAPSWCSWEWPTGPDDRRPAHGGRSGAGHAGPGRALGHPPRTALLAGPPRPARRHAARAAGHAGHRGRGRVWSWTGTSGAPSSAAGSWSPGPEPRPQPCRPACGSSAPGRSRLPTIRIDPPGDGGAALDGRRPGIWRPDATTGWCSARPTPSTALLGPSGGRPLVWSDPHRRRGAGNGRDPDPLADRTRAGPRTSRGRRPAGGLSRPARDRGPQSCCREPRRVGTSCPQAWRRRAGTSTPWRRTGPCL